MCFFAYSSAITAVIFAIISTASGDTFGSTIQYYNGNTTGTFTSYNLTIADNVVANPTFLSNRTSILFIHGWRQSPTAIYSQELINAYITNGNYNILVLNWSQAASSIDLFLVMSRVDELGREVALFVDRMNRRGLPFAKVHLVGHSLGANVASAAGKYTVQWSGSTKFIDRITGLDPAGPYPYTVSWQWARFVDIIHTDAGNLGTNQNSGHVDFWPNSGTAFQPGCSTFPITTDQYACSHMRALNYWNESVKRKDHVSFLSVNQANSAIIIQMGNNCPTSYVQGAYSLTTNSTSWFSKS